MDTEPDSVRALIGPPPVEDSETLPLTVLTSTVPATRPSRTLPDTVVISASFAEPTMTAPDLVEARHRPVQSSTSIFPDPVRRSTSSAAATRILPLAEVTLTEPSEPCSSTAPEVVPTMRWVPVGQRTWIAWAGWIGWISTTRSS